MLISDLAVAWISEHDTHFVELLEASCRDRGLSIFQVTPANLDQVLGLLHRGELRFRALLDRSSDEDTRFLPLAEWAAGDGAVRINPLEESLRAADKAAMHLGLVKRVTTPFTIVLPPYRQAPDLGALDLGPLGATFTTKPAGGGGGEGVFVVCTCLDDVQTARRVFPEDRYLLQERVVPVRLGARPAWFRVIYSTGNVYPCWWDTETHVYTPVTVPEAHHWGLGTLRDVASTLARISRLHLFSTEVAIVPDGSFLVIDYVNDPLDLRPQSQGHDGVPDDILRFIADDLVDWVGSHLDGAPPPGPESHPS